MNILPQVNVKGNLFIKEFNHVCKPMDYLQNSFKSGVNQLSIKIIILMIKAT